MGQTDVMLNPIYAEKTKDFNGLVLCIGFRKRPAWLPRSCVADCRDLYHEDEDKQLDINEAIENWTIDNYDIYDGIVCTRVAYFSKSPIELVERLSIVGKKNCKILIDWGIGDHWRFEPLNVGWYHPDGVQEFAYASGNFLWSTVWNNDWASDSEVWDFFLAMERHDKKYDMTLGNTTNQILEEFPVVVNTRAFEKHMTGEWTHHMFWPEAPQLYHIFKGVINGDT
jgi:hypothetical protein